MFHCSTDSQNLISLKSENVGWGGGGGHVRSPENKISLNPVKYTFDYFSISNSSQHIVIHVIFRIMFSNKNTM